MNKPATHCLVMMEGLYQEHRGCDCKKVDLHDRCACSCNGPSHCGCTCSKCVEAKKVPFDLQPNYYVLMHPHPKASFPMYFDAGSKDNAIVWTSDRANRARRFASEADAEAMKEKLTAAPVYVMVLPKGEV